MAIYYVDFENVHINGLNGAESLDSNDTILIFCREKDVISIKKECKLRKIDAFIKCCVVYSTTKNALDFELISELFMDKCNEIRYIISHDKGFEAAVERGLRKGILCFRKESINDMGFLNELNFYKSSCREEVINVTDIIYRDKKW